MKPIEEHLCSPDDLERFEERAAIMEYDGGLPRAEAEALAGTRGRITVTCYTPAGEPVEVLANDAEHAAWLIRVNPPPACAPGKC